MKDRDEIRAALTGPVASIRTPFTKDGEVDYDGLGRMIDFDIEAGSKALLLTAGDSHYFCLTDEEIATLTRAVVRRVAGRAMVVAADRQFATPAAVSFARFAREAGADVVMVLPPDWAQSTTPETLADHYAAVSRQAPVMVVTNLFASRGEAFGLKTIDLTLLKAPGVVAVKDDICGEFARKLALMAGRRWTLFSGGQKQNHMNMLPYGCDGYLSTFITFSPDVARRYWMAVEAGDLAAATAVIRDVDMPFFAFIKSLPGGFDAAMHGILELKGLAQRWRRPPYYSLDEAEMGRLREFMEGRRLL